MCGNLNHTGGYVSPTTFTTNTTSIIGGSNAYYTNTSSVDLSIPRTRSKKSIETGRVEKGEKSKQKFTEVDIDFEKHYISSTIIQILPESRKPVETKDIFNKKTGEINVKKESDEVIELIKKLADLHSAGILTDEEFSEKKTELLSKI